MITSILAQHLYRKFLLTRVHDGALRRYLETPLPEINKSVYDSEFVALDFETTGLNPEKDRILSIGLTVIRHGRIILGENKYILIDPGTDMTSSNVAIHSITDDTASRGTDFASAIEMLLGYIAGRPLITHHSVIEKNFLNAACKYLYGHGLPLVVIDTLQLAKKRMEHQHQIIKPNSLRLFNLRSEYGLPRYKAHNSLEDAIATAELFLAIASYKTDDYKTCKLKTFL